MLEILAILFLVGFGMRASLLLVDDGFGGPVWVAIFYASALTWFVGAALAVRVLVIS